MFAKMIAGLRAEAELVNASNCMMLANSHKQGWDLVNQVSGKAAKDRTTITGAAMGMGGFVGLMGVAMANQAAALGSAGLLASASTALAGLGTVAVGTAVLPLATVLVLGTSVAGLATMGVAQLMKTDYSRAADFVDAIKTGDREAMGKLSAQNLGLSDWLKGAKNFLGKALTGRILELQAHGTENERTQPSNQIGAALNRQDAVSAYELEDLFGSALESQMGKQLVVEAIGRDVWGKFGVGVSDDKIHECLSGSRADTMNIGKILAVNQETGLVVQSLGRGNATVHRLKDFAKLPEVGKSVEIIYKGGKMLAGQEQGKSGELER